MGRMERQDMVKSFVSESRHKKSSCGTTTSSTRSGDSFSSYYNYYDSNKHSSDYLYPTTSSLLGTWKHYNLSTQTLVERNRRDTSPVVHRELGRYYGTQKRSDYLGSVSSGCATDFRHYNYRPVPYLGGSDYYKHINKVVLDAVY